MYQWPLLHPGLQEMLSLNTKMAARGGSVTDMISRYSPMFISMAARSSVSMTKWLMLSNPSSGRSTLEALAVAAILRTHTYRFQNKTQGLHHILHSGPICVWNRVILVVSCQTCTILRLRLARHEAGWRKMRLNGKFTRANKTWAHRFV